MEVNKNENMPELQEDAPAQSITLNLSAPEVELVNGLCDLFFDTQSEVATPEELGEVVALRDKVSGDNRLKLADVDPEGEGYAEHVLSESQSKFIGQVLYEWTKEHKKDNLTDAENTKVNEVLMALFG